MIYRRGREDFFCQGKILNDVLRFSIYLKYVNFVYKVLIYLRKWDVWRWVIYEFIYGENKFINRIIQKVKMLFRGWLRILQVYDVLYLQRAGLLGRI